MCASRTMQGQSWTKKHCCVALLPRQTAAQYARVLYHIATYTPNGIKYAAVGCKIGIWRLPEAAQISLSPALTTPGAHAGMDSAARSIRNYAGMPGKKHASVTRHARTPPQHSRANLANLENRTNQGGPGVYKAPPHISTLKSGRHSFHGPQKSQAILRRPLFPPPVSGGECGLGVARTDYPWWKAAAGGQ